MSIRVQRVKQALKETSTLWSFILENCFLFLVEGPGQELKLVQTLMSVQQEGEGRRGGH